MYKEELMPFHLLQYKKECYIINIEKMQSNRIDHDSYKFLKGLESDVIAALTPELHTKLKHLGLLTKAVDRTPAPVSQKTLPITHMSLLVTQDCNLRCLYCYENKKPARMDEKTAFQAVDWLIKKSGNMRTIHIVFFGGEPLLNIRLIKAVVDYSKEKAQNVGKDVIFSITTNGTLLNNEIIHFLQQHQFKVMISFDGSKELQDTQRPFASGIGSYDLIAPKIKKLLTVMPQVTGHAVLMGNTPPEVVKDALQGLGFQHVSIAMNSQSLFSDDNQETNACTRNTKVMYKAMDQEASTWLDRLKEGDYSYLKNMIGRSHLYEALLSLINHTKKRYFCGVGRSMVAVTPSEDIYLCQRFVGLDHYRIGNLGTPKLNLESFPISPVDDNSICSGCFARYYCGGGCKHDHVSSCGSIHQPEAGMCYIKQHELELAAVIISNLSIEEQSLLVMNKIFPPRPCPIDF